MICMIKVTEMVTEHSDDAVSVQLLLKVSDRSIRWTKFHSD